MDQLKGSSPVPLAEEISKKDTGARIGGLNTVRTGYGAYAVAGNVVMMCELELSSLVTMTQEATRSTHCLEIEAGYSEVTVTGY